MVYFHYKLCIEIMKALSSCLPGMCQCLATCISLLYFYTHELANKVFGRVADVVPVRGIKLKLTWKGSQIIHTFKFVEEYIFGSVMKFTSGIDKYGSQNVDIKNYERDICGAKTFKIIQISEEWVIMLS